MNNIKIRAYGKLNLYLDITGKRSDGYHLLRSVMQSVSIYDTLDFDLTEGSGIELRCSCPNFPLDSSNLIWKAAELFQKETGILLPGKLTVDVDKNIPSMAGMAGGSADCAAALTALNELTGSKLSRNELLELAAKLGADVPFTLVGGTCLCEGIGEKLKQLPDVKDIYFAAVQPDVRVSTPEAYRAYDSKTGLKKKSYQSFEDAVRAGDAQLIADGLFNALEAAVELDDITEAKEKLITYGALGALMTGSGSVVFGVFDKKEEAEKCIERMGEYPFSGVLSPVQNGIETVR